MVQYMISLLLAPDCLKVVAKAASAWVQHLEPIGFRLDPSTVTGQEEAVRKDDKVYLTSPEVCVACAVTGKITDPRDLGEYPNISLAR